MIAQLRTIEIPDAQAWTEAAAQAWWRKHRPAVASEAYAPPMPGESAATRVLVPQRDDLDIPAISHDAATHH